MDDAPLRFLPNRLRSLFTVLPAMARDAPDYMVRSTRRYGGILALSPGRIHLVSHPDLVKHVLQDNHVNYIKGRHWATLKPLMGEGLLTADGETWRKQRHLTQPAFQRKHHPMMFQVAVDSIQEMLDRWEGNAAREQAVNLRAELVQLSLSILLRTMFSTDLHGHEQELCGAFIEIQKSMDLVDALNPFRIPRWVPTPANRRFHESVQTLERFIFRIVEERRRNGADTGDVVSLLVFARDEANGGGLNDRELRDGLITILQAGNDTISDAMAWAWYLLSKHPEVQARLEQEVSSVLQGKAPAFEDLNALTYTAMVVKEAMRLYPPAWVIAREPIADDVIGGYRIPARSLVAVSPYVTHRLPEFWDEPEEFRPERFSPERSAGRHRFAYYPFGGGPRQCIGAGMAMMEGQLMLSMVTKRFRLVMHDSTVLMKPRISLSPDRIVRVTPQVRAEGGCGDDLRIH